MDMVGIVHLVGHILPYRKLVLCVLISEGIEMETILKWAFIAVLVICSVDIYSDALIKIEMEKTNRMLFKCE
jgi:hypothetical protein